MPELISMVNEHETPNQHAKADPIPQLDVLILLYGTRGDTQPYLRIARVLRETYGHRVRLATAPAFGPLVRDEYGLEFYSTRHDLSPFIEFDQRTNSFGSKLRAMMNGELSRLKKLQAELFESHWFACIDSVEDNKRPFVADAIISTPVAWTPISLAQRLGIPLFLLHANPRSPTRAWPHSTGNPRDTILVECDKNFRTWRAEESKVWKFYFRPLINSLRTRVLGLRPLARRYWPSQFDKLGIPLAYLVSPNVLARPDDWPTDVNVIGYSFEAASPSFHPAQALVEFLCSGSKPIVYVDFSSNVVPDLKHLTSTILEAIQTAGVRAIIRKAWFEADAVPPAVFVTGDLPHSWLFPQVDLIVHACGAGITAMILRSGKPSVGIPIRGDQYLWAKRLEQIGAAPAALSAKDLDTSKLSTAIKQALQPQYRLAAEEKAKALALERDGADVAVELWHGHMLNCNGYLPPCSILATRAAVWTVRAKPVVKLSALAAHILTQEILLRYTDLELIRTVNWEVFKALKGPSSPMDDETDIVRQKRISQGAFDFDLLTKSDGLYPSNAITDGKGGANGRTKEDSQSALVIRATSKWRYLSSVRAGS